MLVLAEHAACADLDPVFTDATDPRYAATALERCRACIVVDLCEQVVAPRDSYYDGVCGGRIWVNGVELGTRRGHREPTIRPSCGTEYGYDQHRVHGEKQCPRCKAVKAERRAARKRQREEQWRSPSTSATPA